MQFGTAQVPSGAGGRRASASGPASDAQVARPDDDKEVGWFSLLSKPVNLPDGLALKTLSDAGAYILDLPDHLKQRDSWQRAADLILHAAAGKIGRANVCTP